MNIIEYTEQIKRLSMIYFKEINQEYIKESYSYFKDIKVDILKEAIDNIIKNNKYMPSISEILENCNTVKGNLKDKILVYMNSQGYFKEPRQYVKALEFIKKGIIPDWLKEDMKYYYKKLLNEEKLLIDNKKEQKNILLEEFK